jgi:hypothetical protein
VREILKVTEDPEFIPFAIGFPNPGTSQSRKWQQPPKGISPFFRSSFIGGFIIQRVGERKGRYLHQTLYNLLISLVCVRLVGTGSLKVIAL